MEHSFPKTYLWNDRRLEAAVLCAVTALLVGCNQQTLELFFDGVNDPPVETGPSRKELLARLKALELELVAEQARLEAAKEAAVKEIPPAERQTSWAEVRSLLPKTEGGHDDWVRALHENLVAPRAGPVPQTLDQYVLRLDVSLSSSISRMWHVRFAHDAHTEWVGCGSCHPSPFSTRRPRARINMTEIMAGRQCGKCHGSVVFGISECDRCHVSLPDSQQPADTVEARSPLERASTLDEAAEHLPATVGGGVDWVAALEDAALTPQAGFLPGALEAPVVSFKPIKLVPEGDEDMMALFPHREHTMWLSCKNCHPSIYRMRWGEGKDTMDEMARGEGCGRCHGPVAFGISDNCGRCHPALE